MIFQYRAWKIIEPHLPVEYGNWNNTHRHYKNKYSSRFIWYVNPNYYKVNSSQALQLIQCIEGSSLVADRGYDTNAVLKAVE